jgi:hypothetical protein
MNQIAVSVNAKLPAMPIQFGVEPGRKSSRDPMEESPERLMRTSTRYMGRLPRGNSPDLIEPLSRYPRTSAEMITATDNSKVTQSRIRTIELRLERPA